MQGEALAGDPVSAVKHKRGFPRDGGTEDTGGLRGDALEMCTDLLEIHTAHGGGEA